MNKKKDTNNISSKFAIRKIIIFYCCKYSIETKQNKNNLVE